MRNTTKKFADFFLDLVFPFSCVGCKAKKTLLCDACASLIPLRSEHKCPLCRKHTTPYGKVCPDCLGRSPLDGIFAASRYENPILSATIHLHKYRCIKELSEPLGDLLVEAVRASDIPLPDTITPVPLHAWRLRWRGFNQSELLARRLCERLSPPVFIPLVHGVQRHRFTRPQMSIKNARERHTHILGAFQWDENISKESIAGKTVWVVDDVATTGSTLQEIARVLKEAGAAKVFGIVLAQ